MQKIWFGLLLIGLLLSVTPSTATTTRAALFERIAAETAITTDAEPLSAIPCINGTADGYPCENVDLMSFMPLNAIGGGSGNDIWGWTDPTNGNEYALMGRTNGTAFIDVTDPVNPVYLGNLPTHTVSSSWRDIKVYADHAFIVSEAGNHGMQVFDLTQLRNVTSPTTFSSTVHYAGFGSSHNIVINEDSGYAYSVGDTTCSGGLHMIDIRNPTAPTFVGCFSSDGYTHDAQCVNYDGPDTEHRGKEICLNSNEDTLTIVDVTNKSAPVQLSRTSYSGASYTHQGWLTQDQAYFLLDDEGDEQTSGNDTTTYIWDVNDLDNPINTGNYESGNSAIDHNLYIHEGLAYQSNYTSGLRILSTSDIANSRLEELAFFDVYPQHNSATFSGTWSNYPYFASGNVIVSSIDRGLFVLRPTLQPGFNLLATPTNVTLCTPNSTTVDVSVSSVLGFSEAVTLSLSGLPLNTTGSFSPEVIMPGSSSTLNLTASTGATDSTVVTIEGNAGDVTKSTTFTLNRLETPSSPQELTPADGATQQSPRPVLTWAEIADVTYRLEIAADSAFTEDVQTYTLSEATFQPYTSLEPNTTYYWRVRAFNVCGESTFVTSSFTTAEEPVAEGNSVAQYTGDFEDGRDGWGGISWVVSTDAAHNGTASLHAPGSENKTQRITSSATFSLPEATNALRLNFWHRYDLQASAAGCMDGGILEVSANSGSWQKLNSELYGDSYTGPVRSETSSLSLNTGAWCGDSDGWRSVSADLSAFAGDDVRFRFRLANDSGVESAGWYIDDIELTYYVDGFSVYLPVTIND